MRCAGTLSLPACIANACMRARPEDRLASLPEFQPFVPANETRPEFTLRALGRASILENNIVQTTGNAGQSIAAGVIFTLPALIFLGFDLEYFRIFILALLGGWLGVLFMIPLRRQLIVEEHGN